MSSGFLGKSLNPFFFCDLVRTPNSELRTCGLTRRLFLRWLLGVPLLSSFPFYVPETKAALVLPPKNERRTSIAEFFKGEDLLYEIGVWPFDRVALGRLGFKEMGQTGQYRAILQAETQGVLGWAARYRVDTYCSIMEEVEEGTRFRSLSFEEDVKIGSKLRKRIHFFDYQRSKWIKVRRRKNGTMVKTEEDIPPGMVYDDFITASYNFRYGAYGEIERGKKYTVATFPKKGSSSYEVIVAGKEEEGRKKSETFEEGKDFYLKLYLDPEITHSKEGLVEGWMSKEFYPIEGAIKDVVLFGDVKGRLIKKANCRSQMADCRFKI